MTRIFLIRHAEAEGNIYRRAHGHFNGQIIGRGFPQIERLRKRFEDVKLDAIYSSDLARTCVTATPLCAQHGHTLITTDRLREVDMGRWEDVAWGDLKHKDPEMERCFSHDPAKWQVSGSEDYMHVRKRMTSCIKDIGERHEGGTAAAFSHGFAIRAFLCETLGIPSAEVDRLKYCDNTAVSLILYDKGDLTIDFHSDNSHLPAELSTFAHQSWWREGDGAVSENLRYEVFDEQRDTMFEETRNLIRAVEYSDEEERPEHSREYTAFWGGQPVGLVAVDVEREVEEGNGWINIIHVRPEFRGRNFGVQLLGQAIAELRKLGRERIRVEVETDATALSFYFKYDFMVLYVEGSRCILEKNIRNW